MSNGAFTATCIAFTALALASCFASSGGGGPDAGNVEPDAGAAPDSSESDRSSPPVDAGEPDVAMDAGAGDAQCAPAVSPVVETDPDGPGYDCMQSGCHLSGQPVQGGLTITVSGTLYDSKGKPLPGATVYVKDSKGQDLVLTSDNNANFWSGYADGTDLPAGNYGTCETYVKCYAPSQYEGACECATYAAAGALQATSVSMCPNGTQSCTSLGTGASNGDCHDCDPPSVIQDAARATAVAR